MRCSRCYWTWSGVAGLRDCYYYCWFAIALSEFGGAVAADCDDDREADAGADNDNI